MKKEDNSYGVASAILGIFSIMFSYPPLYGVILGIISFVFAKKQEKFHKNGWSKAGKILSVIGIILSILVFIFLLWLAQHPELLPALGDAYALQ